MGRHRQGNMHSFGDIISYHRAYYGHESSYKRYAQGNTYAFVLHNCWFIRFHKESTIIP